MQPAIGSDYRSGCEGRGLDRGDAGSRVLGHGRSFACAPMGRFEKEAGSHVPDSSRVPNAGAWFEPTRSHCRPKRAGRCTDSFCCEPDAGRRNRVDIGNSGSRRNCRPHLRDQAKGRTTEANTQGRRERDSLDDGLRRSSHVPGNGLVGRRNRWAIGGTRHVQGGSEDRRRPACDGLRNQEGPARVFDCCRPAGSTRLHR